MFPVEVFSLAPRPVSTHQQTANRHSVEIAKYQDVRRAMSDYKMRGLRDERRVAEFAEIVEKKLDREDSLAKDKTLAEITRPDRFKLEMNRLKIAENERKMAIFTSRAARISSVAQKKFSPEVIFTGEPNVGDLSKVKLAPLKNAFTDFNVYFQTSDFKTSFTQRVSRSQAFHERVIERFAEFASLPESQRSAVFPFLVTDPFTEIRYPVKDLADANEFISKTKDALVLSAEGNNGAKISPDIRIIKSRDELKPIAGENNDLLARKAAKKIQSAEYVFLEDYLPREILGRKYSRLQKEVEQLKAANREIEAKLESKNSEVELSSIDPLDSAFDNFNPKENFKRQIKVQIQVNN